MHPSFTIFIHFMDENRYITLVKIHFMHYPKNMKYIFERKNKFLVEDGLWIVQECYETIAH